MLRFFEQRDLRSIGEVLGSNEDAAQQRVARALEKLRALLSRRGIAFSSTGLATLLAAEAISAAPVALNATISSAVISSAATGSALTLFNIMATTKLKIGIVSAIVIGGVTASLVINHQAQAVLQAEDQSLQRQASQAAHLTAENARLADLLRGRTRRG